MKVETLKIAIAEAERFLAKAKAVPVLTVHGEGMMAGKKWNDLPSYCTQSAACKRASMDLTRALAAMRKL